MSSSRQFSDSQSQGGKAPQKSTNFVQTCNLLSRYIKEKRSLGDLNLEIGGKLESLDAIVKQSPIASSASTAVNSLRNTEVSAQPASEPMPIKEDTRSTSQLTIFYSGRVLIFDDYPADSVREIVTFARKRSSQMSYGVLPNNIQENPEKVDTRKTASNVASNAREALQLSKGKQLMNRTSTNSVKENAKFGFNEDLASSSRAKDEELSPQSDTNGSDLPIARRSSLHRFLAKRKDRAVGRGPYPVHDEHNGSSSSSSKGNHQFDLNL